MAQHCVFMAIYQSMVGLETLIYSSWLSYQSMASLPTSPLIVLKMWWWFASAIGLTIALVGDDADTP